MHQMASDGLPVSYSQYTSTPELGDYCTTQSAGHPIDYTGEDPTYNTSSPASQGTETSEPILTPSSDLPPFHHRPELSPYPYQEGYPATPSPNGLFPTPPPSAKYEIEERENLSQLDSPIYPAPGFLPSYHCPGSSSVASPRSWPSEPQHLRPPPFSWRDSDLQSQNMRICNSSLFEDNLSQQMATSSYDSTSYNYQGHMESEYSGHRSEASMIADMAEQSPTLSMQGESPQLKAEMMSDSYEFDEDEDMQDIAVPADNSEGDDGAKSEEPYARIIWRALMSRERHAMTLQEIYQWFRDNTEKAKGESKGWQNSIRHNLSMNAAFQKCDRKSSTGDILPDSQQTKKSTEWVLEDWAVRDGVQSTTRYRKGNPSRRGGSATQHHRAHGSISARASSGRKGGISSSKNKVTSSKRSMMNQAMNPDLPLFNAHVDPIHDPAYSRSNDYYYAPGPLNTHPATTPIGHSDILFRVPSLHTPTLPTSSNAHSYPYNGAQSQVLPGFSHQGQINHLYPVGSVAGVYQGPQTPAHTRLHHPTATLSPGYSRVFANPEELVDERASYLAWNGSAPGGGSYDH